jgi:hypothetical protein
MSSAEETPDYKRLTALIAPEKHLCIKYKQRVARIGIVCDDCLAPVTIEEKYMTYMTSPPTNPTLTLTLLLLPLLSKIIAK